MDEKLYWPDVFEMLSFTTEESLLFFKAIEAPANGLPWSSWADPVTCCSFNPAWNSRIDKINKHKAVFLMYDRRLMVYSGQSNRSCLIVVTVCDRMRRKENFF